MKKACFIIIIATLIAAPLASYSQNLWVKSYAGSTTATFSSLCLTPEGGTVLAGYVESGSSGPGLEESVVYDACLVKLDSSGEILWQKSYGGSDDDLAYSVIAVSGGGYLAVGETYSFDAALDDAMVLRINEDGELIWAKRVGGTGEDWAIDVKQKEDGSFIVLGTSKAGSAPSEAGATYDIWLFGLDKNGELLWQKTYDGGLDDAAYSLTRTVEGDCIIAGATTSYGGGDNNAFLIKTDSGGLIKWQKVFGGPKDDYAFSAIEAPDGGFLVVGETYLKNTPTRKDYSNAWVLKINAFGGDEWQKAYGSSQNNFALSAAPAGKHGFIVAGGSKSSSASYDAWAFKIDWSGKIIWKHNYDLSGEETIYAVAPAGGEKIILLGSVVSSELGYPFLTVTDKNGSTGSSCPAVTDSSITKQKLSSGSGTPSFTWKAGTATAAGIKKDITPGITGASSETICQAE
jgi:hypothetical protein